MMNEGFITISSYRKNPTFGTAAGYTEQLISDLNKRYEKIQHRIEIKKYKIGKSKIFHVKIPSESFDKLFYDVLIEIDNPENKKISITHLPVKFFSNSPGFTFYNAYTYELNDLLITWIGNKKYNRIVLKDAPESNNPQLVLKHDKIIFFACKAIENESVDRFNLSSAGITKMLLSSKIPDSDTKKLEYDRLKKIEDNKKKQEKKEQKKQISSPSSKEKIQPLNKNTTKDGKKAKITPNTKVKPKKKK